MLGTRTRDHYSRRTRLVVSNDAGLTISLTRSARPMSSMVWLRRSIKSSLAGHADLAVGLAATDTAVMRGRRVSTSPACRDDLGAGWRHSGHAHRTPQFPTTRAPPLKRSISHRLPILIASLADDIPEQHTTLAASIRHATVGPRRPKCFCVAPLRRQILADKPRLPCIHRLAGSARFQTAQLYLDTGNFKAPRGPISAALI